MNYFIEGNVFGLLTDKNDLYEKYLLRFDVSYYVFGEEKGYTVNTVFEVIDCVEDISFIEYSSTKKFVKPSQLEEYINETIRYINSTTYLSLSPTEGIDKLKEYVEKVNKLYL